ncbi:MAG: glycosyltransferase [Clostridiales bacterium]|nr:glycosyltransferase [Clostridiales bacterium]MCF8022851.1 glycosyltransferase [Clostridiales bacterium]
MFKIGVITPWNIPCGISEYSKYLIEYGLKDKNVVIFARYDDNLIRNDEQNVVRCWHKDNFYELINYILPEHSLNVINIQYEPGIMDTYMAALAIQQIRNMGIKVITTLHATTYNENLKENIIAQNSDCTITHTTAIGNNNTEIPHAFLNLDINHKHNRNEFDKKYNTYGKLLVGHFGFPFLHKGHKNIIDAVNKINNAVLVFIFGKRQDTISNVQQIQQYMESINCNYVVIHDFLEIENIINILSACNAACFSYPQDTPGHSGAVRIAMAAKIPIVATPSNVIKDVLPYINVYNIEDFPNVLIKADNSKLEYLSYIEENSWENAGKKYLDVFKNC